MTKRVKKGKHRGRLGRDLSIAGIIFTICISIGMGCIGYVPYYKNMYAQYESYQRGIINLVLPHIDGDDLEEYLEEGNDLQDYPKVKALFKEIDETQEIHGIFLEELLPGAPDEEGYDYYFDHYDNIYVYSCGVSVRNSEHKEICYLVVELNVNDMRASLKYYSKPILTGAAINALVFFINLFLWIRKRVVKPINALNNSADAFVKSCREKETPEELTLINADIKTHDEMRNLADSLEEMALDVQKSMISLRNETKEKERIDSELRIASEIQQSILPCIFPPFPEREEFDIYATMNPAKEVGGDFYDFFMLDDNHLGFVVGDVSGKGVPAALFMVIGKTLIKDYSAFGDSLGDVFTKVNDLLCEANTSGLFITAFEGILDLTTGELEFVNAGHEKPFIYRAAEEKWELYPTRSGFVLAGMEGMKYKSGKLKLEKGDRIFLYTDGISEAVNSNDEQYGKDRLQKALTDNRKATIEELLPLIRKDVDSFVGGIDQFDDITMLGLNFKGAANKND